MGGRLVLSNRPGRERNGSFGEICSMCYRRPYYSKGPTILRGYKVGREGHSSPMLSFQPDAILIELSVLN
jgi:hypothetical protein